MADTVKEIIGFIPFSYISERTNCPEADATAPKADAIPKPKPLALKGKISVTYKNKIEK